jgi:hypothetical protein
VRRVSRTGAAPALVVIASLLTGFVAASETVPEPARLRLEQDLRALADDAMEGRRSGEAGAEKAANYIAEAFRHIGLQPAGTEEYLQPFQVTTGVRLGPRNRLRIRWRDASLEGRVGKDFIPLAFSKNGHFRGRLVFAGYGISSSEPEYDDYEGTSVDGRAVLILRHEPQERREKSPFDGAEFTYHANLRHKTSNARQNGATALLLVNDALHHTPEEDVLLPLVAEETTGLADVLVVHVRREWLQQLGAAAVPNLKRWQKRVDRKLIPDSRVLEGIEVDLEVDLEKRRRVTHNVLGLLEGSRPGLRKQTVLIGAHYDHLGHGDSHSLEPEAQDEIHNGADDNASGVSALLEIARALVKRHQQIGRSVLFAAFAGEEMGLLGSSHYAANPTQPLDRMVSMINLDMVGRSNEGRLSIGGAGTSPGFEDMLRRLNEPYGFALDLSMGGFGPSDHTPFYARQLPVLFFFTGAHADYHRPSDDVEHINFEGLERISRLVSEVTFELAGAEEAPVFTEVEEEAPAVGEGYGRRGYGAYLGTIPEFGETKRPGVTITGVRRDSPAARAGLRAGDRIVRFGSIRIDNLYDLTYALRTHRAGDRIKLRYVREDQEIDTKAVLGVRP